MALLEKYNVASDTPWLQNEAHLVNDALDMGVIDPSEAARGLSNDKELLDMMQRMVRVTYFVEYPHDHVPREERGERLMELFTSSVSDNPEDEYPLARYLADNRQSVSLAMETLDEKTAEALRYLNDEGVPVVAWIVLPDELGYWTNRLNIGATKERTKEVLAWAQDNNVELAGIGFDIEKPIEFIKAMATMKPMDIILQGGAYRRVVRSNCSAANAEEELAGYVDELRAQGVQTEMYVMPRMTKRLLGGMQVDGVADATIEMTYTSDFRPLRKKGRGLHLLLSRHAIPALGIVSGKPGEGPGRRLAGERASHHLTREEVAQHIGVLLGKRLNLQEREFNLHELYMFALNDPSVATMTNEAMRAAFSKVTA